LLALRGDLELGIRRRVNATLIATFLVGLFVSCGIAYFAEYQHAHDEVMLRARLLLDSARSVRSYIGESVEPLLVPPKVTGFVMQSTPAFGARETFDRFRKTYPDYSYREAALNPTNTANRALSWETDIIRRFAEDTGLSEQVGEHREGNERFLYIAEPIRITEPGCLACHSTPAAAPKELVEQYGAAGGFGWQLGQVVGTQIVSVPMRVATYRARESFLLFTLLLAGIFTAMLVVVNFVVQRHLVRPLQSFSAAADSMSRGEAGAAELADAQPVREIGMLAQSINRLHRSFRTALALGEGR